MNATVQDKTAHPCYLVSGLSDSAFRHLNSAEKKQQKKKTKKI